MKDEDLGLIVKELQKQAKSVATHMREKSGSREAGPLNLVNLVEKTPSDNEVRIKGLLKLVDYFKTENENIDTNVYDSVALQQVKDFGFTLPSSPELCEKVFLDGSRAIALGVIQKSYEMKVQKLLPKISEINEEASKTGFDPITDIDELPFYHPDIIIAKPERDLEGKCGTVYKVFDRRMANRKGMIRALKINKEETVSGTKILTDGDLGIHTPHIIRREEKTDIISREIGYSLDWFDYSLNDYLTDKKKNMQLDLFGTRQYFGNGLDLAEINHFSRQFTQIAWEYHNRRKELCLDLKPENVMVDLNSAGEYPDLLYSDTGISTPINRSKSKASRNSVGTEYIRSPKLFNCSSDSDEKDDIFSVVSNIYNLFTGKFLFQEEIDNYDKESLDTFIDSLLVGRGINRKVMDSVLDEKFERTEIPPFYQYVIREGVLGDYENTDELKNRLLYVKSQELHKNCDKILPDGFNVPPLPQAPETWEE